MNGTRLTFQSIRCRLPQTPRTPSTAAAHYFDDIFHKYKPAKPKFRRSSTSRSIGKLEDLEGDFRNGVAIEDEPESPVRPMKRVNSVGYFDDAAIEKKKQIDEQVAGYISGKLQKMRSHESAGEDMNDELEAQLDGA